MGKAEEFQLIVELVKREFKERYIGSALGIWWSFIWPIVNIFTYTVIFSQVMGVKLKGLPTLYSYGLYLSSGLIFWTSFSNSVLRITNIFLEKKGLITKIPFSLKLFPITVILSETITFLINFSLLLLILILLKIPPSLSSLAIILASYIGLHLLAYSSGLILATLNVFLRDIKEIANIVLQLWFWFTPIVYTLSIVPQKIKKFILTFNPAYSFIQVPQKLLITHEKINLFSLTIYSVITLILFTISLLFLKKLEKDVRDFL